MGRNKPGTSSPAPSPKTPTSAKGVKKSQAPPRKSNRSVWKDTDRLLGEAKSPLYLPETDIEQILTTALEKGLLPPDIAAKLSELSPKDFKDAVEDFKNSGVEGMNDAEWRIDAQTAYEERTAGKFDKFIEAKLEEEWGVKPE